MNRRSFLKSSLLVAVGAAVITPDAFAAPGMIGHLEPSEFKKINKAAGAKVEAIKPTKEPLSEDDAKLFVEVAMGGMMQLELSRTAVSKAASADVRIYAQGEVEEQTILSAKLREIASAKGAVLPAGPDEKTQKLLGKLQEKNGPEFDREYLKESGVNGHQLLEKTMTRVQSKAADPTLKIVASTALPLIQTHLQLAKEEIKDLA